MAYFAVIESILVLAVGKLYIPSFAGVYFNAGGALIQEELFFPITDFGKPSRQFGIFATQNISVIQHEVEQGNCHAPFQQAVKKLAFCTLHN